MNATIDLDLTKPRYLSQGFIRALDAALHQAVVAVEEGKAAKGQVAVSFAVEWTEDGLVGKFQIRGSQTTKGTWSPMGLGQMRLLDGDEEA